MNMVFHLCEFSYRSRNYYFYQNVSHKFHNDMVSHLCGFFMMDFFLKTFPQMSHVTKFLSVSVLHWLWFYLTSKHFFNFSWETPATFSLTVFPHIVHHGGWTTGLQSKAQPNSSHWCLSLNFVVSVPQLVFSLPILPTRPAEADDCPCLSLILLEGSSW